jgi:hypothetical protein
LLYTSQNLLEMIFRVTFTVFYRRIWSIVEKYSILCCDSIVIRISTNKTAFQLSITVVGESYRIVEIHSLTWSYLIIPVCHHTWSNRKLGRLSSPVRRDVIKDVFG